MNQKSYVHPLPGSNSRVERSFRPPLWLVLAGTISLALVAMLIIVRQQTTNTFAPLYIGGARAQLSQTLFDYGDVKNETQIQTSFSVKNIGDRQLQFKLEPLVEVVEGCCPPRAIIDKMELDPGEEATVRFAFSMHEGMDGPHEFRVTMRTNDAEAPEQEVTVLSNWVK